MCWNHIWFCWFVDLMLLSRLVLSLVNDHGSAALKPVLVSEGVYADLCDFDPVDGPIVPCKRQVRDISWLLTRMLHILTRTLTNRLPGPQTEPYVHDRNRCYQCALFVHFVHFPYIEKPIHLWRSLPSP